MSLKLLVHPGEHRSAVTNWDNPAQSGNLNTSPPLQGVSQEMHSQHRDLEKGDWHVPSFSKGGWGLV